MFLEGALWAAGHGPTEAKPAGTPARHHRSWARRHKDAHRRGLLKEASWAPSTESTLWALLWGEGGQGAPLRKEAREATSPGCGRYEHGHHFTTTQGHQVTPQKAHSVTPSPPGNKNTSRCIKPASWVPEKEKHMVNYCHQTSALHFSISQFCSKS